MDNTIRELARLAGTGDLDAARRLVRHLERSGQESQEDAILRQAIETLAAFRKASWSGVHDDVLDVGEVAFRLAKVVVSHLVDPVIKESAFGVRLIGFANGSGVRLEDDGSITAMSAEMFPEALQQYEEGLRRLRDEGEGPD